MQILRQRIPWNRQPPAGTPVDWSNPVVKALAPTDLWVPDGFGGRNLVRPAHANTKKSSVFVGPAPYGLAINGTGVDPTTSVSGYETTAGACNYTGVSHLTMFALVSFAGHKSGTYEASLLRTDKDGTPSDTHMVLDVFQNNTGYVIRPLLVTDGTSGWTVNNDVSVGLPKLNMLYLVVARYSNSIESGIRVFFSEAGGSVASLKNPSSQCTGAMTTNGSSATGMQTHLAGMAYVGAGSLFGSLYYAGISASAISDDAVRSWANNPWMIFQP